jgi:hypothetical protein
MGALIRPITRLVSILSIRAIAMCVLHLHAYIVRGYKANVWIRTLDTATSRLRADSRMRIRRGLIVTS